MMSQSQSMESSSLSRAAGLSHYLRHAAKRQPFLSPFERSAAPSLANLGRFGRSVPELGPHRSVVRGRWALGLLTTHLGLRQPLHERRGGEDVVDAQALVLRE